jgi:hypothetical protein
VAHTDLTHYKVNATISMRMNDDNFISSLIRHASAQGARSNVLNPLHIFIAMLLSSTIISFIRNLTLLSYILGFFTIIALLTYIFCYLYLMFKDRDFLRSEKYSIQKMAIEKGFYGDSTSGVVELDNIGSIRRALPLGSANNKPLK